MRQKTTIKGTLLFDSETGTEGGWYAVQDDQFIHGEVEMCPWGQLTPFTDGRRACPGMRSYWEGTEEPPEVLAHASYEGLLRLENGDHLRIFDKDGTTVRWEGDINLERLPLFTHDVMGLWVNQRQQGVDEDTWATMFFEELPCELERDSNPARVKTRATKRSVRTRVNKVERDDNLSEGQKTMSIRD